MNLLCNDNEKVSIYWFIWSSVSSGLLLFILHQTPKSLQEMGWLLENKLKPPLVGDSAPLSDKLSLQSIVVNLNR